MAKKWIQKAVSKNPGAFKAQAKAAGKTTKEFAQEKKGASGKTGARARLALTLMGMNKGKGGGSSMSENAGKREAKSKAADAATKRQAKHKLPR